LKWCWNKKEKSMAVLDFAKPKKDRLKWKAKQIGGKDPRIEIRKTVVGVDLALARNKYQAATYAPGHCSAQVLIIVRESGVVMSANGRMCWSNKEWLELNKAIAEAQILLKYEKLSLN
jgi:hypothetical protein